MAQGQGLQLKDRVSIGGLVLDRVTWPQVIDQVTWSIEQRVPCHIVTVNLQFLGVARKEAGFADVVNKAGLVVADGKPVQWLSHIGGSPIPQRITGHDLLHGLASLSSKEGYSLFFLGSTPEVAAKAMEELRAQYPSAKVAGTYQGQFTRDGYGASDTDETGAVEAIKANRPDILFVSLGCPKQEFWIYRHLHEIDVPVCVGVGGVLDVLAGKLRRAPPWTQNLGLEWCYRLMQEPGRLWKRYILQDGPTALRLASRLLLARIFQSRPTRAKHLGA